VAFPLEILLFPLFVPLKVAFSESSYLYLIYKVLENTWFNTTCWTRWFPYNLQDCIATWWLWFFNLFRDRRKCVLQFYLPQLVYIYNSTLWRHGFWKYLKCTTLYCSK
jgi:hypothetical protein